MYLLAVDFGLKINQIRFAKNFEFWIQSLVEFF